MGVRSTVRCRRFGAKALESLTEVIDEHEGRFR
jgi:hypothetical protein